MLAVRSLCDPIITNPYSSSCITRDKNREGPGLKRDPVGLLPSLPYLVRGSPIPVGRVDPSRKQELWISLGY